MNYQLSEDLADDDNERDPFSYRYAVANNFKPDYGFSDRNERHRFNAFGLWEAPWGIEFSPLISFHTPQPISVPNRILPRAAQSSSATRCGEQYVLLDQFPRGQRTSKSRTACACRPS